LAGSLAAAEFPKREKKLSLIFKKKFKKIISSSDYFTAKVFLNIGYIDRKSVP
jgi:hypothetical protein